MNWNFQNHRKLLNCLVNGVKRMKSIDSGAPGSRDGACIGHVFFCTRAPFSRECGGMGNSDSGNSCCRRDSSSQFRENWPALYSLVNRTLNICDDAPCIESSGLILALKLNNMF